VPKGLEIPFEIMVDLAAVDYPFEYERGIILKGISTLLVATAKWVVNSVIAVQWHFVDSKDDVFLSKYTDDERYHIWKEKEKPPPELETVRGAIRTFLGWCDTSHIQLGMVEPSEDLAVTELNKVGRSLTLKAVGFNVGVGKAPVTVGGSLTYEVQEGSVRHSRQTRFLEMMSSSIAKPILLYAADEDRGWLVPQLSVLGCMALIYARERGLAPAPPRADLDLEKTRKTLLENSELKLFPQGMDREKAEVLALPLKELLCDLANELEWAEEHARRQRVKFGRDVIYGFEFFELATRAKNYFVKKCSIKDTNGGWVKLLDERVINGVVFCKGLGEVIVCGSARCSFCEVIPRDHSYLAAAISCLQDLKKHGKLPAGHCWNFERTTFEQCSSCSSYEHRLQNMNALARSAGPTTDHPNGVVVFGERPMRSVRERLLSVVRSQGLNGTIA
jgi:hypothetical protein